MSLQKSSQQNEQSRLNHIHLEITRLAVDTHASIDRFINIVRFNDELSRDIIKMVNQAYNGFSGEITSISRAIKLLGVAQLRDYVARLNRIEIQSNSDRKGKNEVRFDCSEDTTELKFAG